MAEQYSNVSRYYAIRKTVMEMLRDRGYLIGAEDFSMTLDKFTSLYSKGGEVKKSDLTLFYFHEYDRAEQVFVFWPDEQKVGVKTIKRFCEKMQSETVYRGIFILQKALTGFAKQAVRDAHDERFILECFVEEELLVNITHHTLVPQHILLTDAEKQQLLSKYKLKEHQLPRILVTDPVARYFGLKKRQVVKIVRPSETAGKYVTYRLVV
eukprot:TRINITY_DN16389_c0_g1_i1.p1 TRINITY_DN16389_c0_g1~~TRINITY_DN16389_c0_g1_i1.p1  ORF type:complete len:210 (+),score=40.40 TRINITY_DN16389_c0_g1_i1:155-784(+)